MNIFQYGFPLFNGLLMNSSILQMRVGTVCRPCICSIYVRSADTVFNALWCTGAFLVLFQTV